MKNLYLGPSASTIRPQPTGACYNCQATVSGKFCAQCGQQAHLHVASVHEFLHHFIGHYVAAEGKLWPTLKALLLRPGQLTLEYIRGRRTHFIDPLRLLLTVSLLAFLAIKLMLLADPVKPAIDAGAHYTTTQAEAEAKMGPLQKAVIDAYRRNSPAFAENYARSYRVADGERVQRFMNAWLAIGPTVALLMIPVIAFWLKLAHLGTGWRYGEHLVFSMHWLAAALCWLVLAQFNRYLWMAFVAMLPLYLLLALRRVYRGNWPLALLRASAIAYLSFTGLRVVMWIILYGRMAMPHPDVN